VLDFYNTRRRDVLAARPNEAHKALAALEEAFDVSVVTQNVDDLHERGGSSRVLHLHGEVLKMRSEKDETLIYPIQEDILLGQLAADGGQLRPHIVWFEEPVPLIAEAAKIMQTADVFILVGSSLQVYPAAGLIDLVPQKALKFIVDKKIPPVGHDNMHLIEKPATEGMKEVLEILLKA
jgi:NAD-dependent deacetylase